MARAWVFLAILLLESAYNALNMAEIFLDGTDRKILELLQKNARIPNTELADEVGLTPAPSRVVAVPRVLESPVSFECRRTQVLQLQGVDGKQVDTWLVLGEVVAVHIAKALLKDGVYDTAAAGHVLRGGGPGDYFTVGPEQLFRMYRPR